MRSMNWLDLPPSDQSNSTLYTNFQCEVIKINQTIIVQTDLHAVDPPVITGQPVSLMLAVPGQSSTFTVVAMGDILMYQWQKNGSNITAGATSDTYTIAAVAARDTGMYRCVVFNAGNSTISTAASLTVCKCISA